MLRYAVTSFALAYLFIFLMEDYSRTQQFPDNRTQVRNPITCPRCRVDPSHISRQYWSESTQPRLLPQAETSADDALAVFANNNSNLLCSNNVLTNNSPLSERISGYPDLCPRFGLTSSYNNSDDNNYRPPVPHFPRDNSSVSVSYYNPGLIRSSENNSTRYSGETWRIRGVFENPDVIRRSDSNPGTLPDVTRHSSIHFGSTHLSTIHHTRISSATNGYEIQNSRPIPSNHNSIRLSETSCRTTSNSFRDLSHVRGYSSEGCSIRHSGPSPWKRENSFSSSWVTRSQSENRAQNHPSNCNNNNSDNNSLNVQSPQPSVSSSTSCWRSSALSASHHVLSQCPLPDLVTPRRQARKQCCGLLATHSVAVRWLVVIVASLGLLCSVVGTVVGVVKASGKEQLSIALLLIGLGIILVSMSGVAWRLTSQDAPSCSAMFGFPRGARNEPHRRFVPRVPHYGRPHPFSAMLYPDIPLRPPPPSYQASMQEYRLRLLLMDRPQIPNTSPPPPPPPLHPPPPPPPPNYRGPATVYTRFPLGCSDYSRPPSYRSRPPSSIGQQPSPLGPDDLESTSQSVISEQLFASEIPNSEVTCLSQGIRSSLSATQRLLPSSGNGINQVEIVAQV